MMDASTVNRTYWKCAFLFLVLFTFFSKPALADAPVLDCSNLDVTISCTTSLSDLPQPSISLDCGTLAETAINFSDDQSGFDDCGVQGVILRTWTATDICGQTATCVQAITITNNAPVLNCNNLNRTISCVMPRGENDLPKPIFSDDCSSASNLSVTFVDDESNLNACGTSGYFTRTWTATDACGLTATCVQTITITDEAPRLNCDDLDVRIECGAPMGENDLPIPTVTDDCTSSENLTLTYIDNTSNINDCQGTIIRTWTATDACGLTSTCVQTITIVKPINTLCQDIQIQTRDNQLILAGLAAPNTIAKVFDQNYQIISNCSGDCPETITIPNLNTDESYHTDIQFYDENWEFICEDKQDIEIVGGNEPCDTSVCAVGVVLKTQAEVDAFCGCEVIEGNLVIGDNINGIGVLNSDINNLNSLKKIKVVKGSFIIRGTPLADLSGLEQLEEIGSDFSLFFNTKLKNLKKLVKIKIVQGDLTAGQNEKLESFEGLENLEITPENISISGNNSLTSLMGLNQLRAINSFQLIRCPNIKSLRGLENLSLVEEFLGLNENTSLETTEGIGNLKEVGVSMSIVNHPSLIDLNGLDNLQKVGRSFVVNRNDNLENISSLKNLTTVEILDIGFNPNLATCCAVAHLVDDDLENGRVGNTITIENNALFCNSPEEILQACQAPPCENIQINTQNNQIVISGLTAANEIVKVFDKDYNIVYQCVANCEDTQMAGTFPVGEYTIDLQLYDENWELICAEQRAVIVEPENGNPCDVGGCETVAPVLANIPGDITAECDAVPEIFLNVTATDNCDSDVTIEFSEERTNESCEDSYSLTRTWTATDNCGNTAQGTQRITIIDSTNPVLADIPADITVECDAIPNEYMNVSAIDNCDAEVTIEFNEERNNGDCQDNYVLTRTWIATDNCGNSTQGIQIIVVQDATPPVLTNLPPDLTFNASDGFDTTFPIPTDNCDSDSELTVEDVVNTEETEIVRTFTATDNCGNTATAQQIITIIREGNNPCDSINITASNEAIRLTNITAPNSIVKVFDPNWQLVFECNATCENELVIPVEGEGIYHIDVQFYDEQWGLICRDKQDVLIESDNCGETIEIVLQPNAEEGKDALLHGESQQRDRNFGDFISIVSTAWTFRGSPGVIRSTIDFDLSAIPPNSIIESAELSLFALDSLDFTLGTHSTRSGLNASWLERIVEPWDEELVTWNNQPSTTSQNSILLPSSVDEGQDYLNTDVSSLVQDMVNDSANSHGFMIRLKEEAYYRNMAFVSSDHPDATRHPKLTIKFQSPSSSVCQGDVILRTQAEVDAFCGCEVIEGDLRIGNFEGQLNNDIDVLSNLENLKEVKGNLLIQETKIKNLNNLSNLKNIGKTLTLVKNLEFENLEGLQNLKEVNENLVINGNPKLTDLEGLNQLIKIGKKIQLEQNTNLVNIEGLSNLKYVGGIGLEFCPIEKVTAFKNIQNSRLNDLNIINCDNLKSLDGLEFVDSVNLGITLAANDLLEDIDALYNITYLGGSPVITSLIIDVNPNLSNCCAIAHLIDDDLTNGIAEFGSNIKDNAQFCNSIEEIIENCQTPSNCITLKPNATQGKDASVWSNAADRVSSEGESITPYTWTNGGRLGIKRVFLGFDFTDIPENAIITQANLSLFYNPTDPFESFDEHTGENDLFIQRVLAPWDTNTLTWNNQPSTTNTNQVALPPSTSGTQDYLDIDVSDLVQDMLSESEGNNGFLIRMADEVNFYKSAIFASSEHPNPALHPAIEICWEVPNPSIDCDKVTITTNQNNLSIANLNAPIQIVKVFDNNYATVYECFAECEEMINLPNLAAGRYHVNIDFYDENWQPICNKVETIQIEASTQNRSTNLLSADFVLFPNPAETVTYLDLNKLKGEKVGLELYNQFGQKVYQSVIEKVVQSQMKIDLTTYQNGLYLLKIKANGKRPIAKKMIINRLY